jgi:hypothetical protein
MKAMQRNKAVIQVSELHSNITMESTVILSDHQKQAIELANITLNDATNKKLLLMPSFIMEHGYQSCQVRMDGDHQEVFNDSASIGNARDDIDQTEHTTHVTCYFCVAVVALGLLLHDITTELIICIRLVL